MAKNTASSSFRKIDVDQYNEDYYKDEEITEVKLPPHEKDIFGLISQGKNIEALKSLLNSSPAGCKNLVLKSLVLELVMKVLLAIKSNEIEKAVSALDRVQVDTLMKYIYAGFGSPSEGRSAHLLAWHEKVYASGGLGCIVRVLTDRKRV